MQIRYTHKLSMQKADFSQNIEQLHKVENGFRLVQFFMHPLYVGENLDIFDYQFYSFPMVNERVL